MNSGKRPDFACPVRRATVTLAVLVALHCLATAPVAARAEPDHSTSPPAAEAAAATRDPLAFDPVELWMASYHLAPTPARIPEMLRTLVIRGALAADSPRTKEFLRFFSAALAADPAALKSLKLAAVSGSSQEQDVALVIATRAENYAPSVPETPAELPLVWAEYRATGDKRSIAVLANLVGGENEGLSGAAAASLLEQVPRHAEARTLLNEILRESPAGLRAKLAPVAATLNEKADLAEVTNQRGRNHERAKQTGEAIRAYRSAMEIYPRYASPYVNLADIYLDADDKTRYPEALAALQVAAAFEPDSASILAAVGRAHFRLGRYDEASRWLSRSRECNPRYAYPVHLLGRVALKQNDVAAAIGHFRAYLALDPSGERLSRKEREILAGAGVAVVEKPVPTLAALLLQEKYELLDVQLSALIRDKAKNRSGGSALINAYDQLVDLPGPAGSSAAWVTLFETWAERRPDSHAARAALGSVLVEYAWEARGHGWASTVLDDRGKLFTGRLLAARQQLEKAYELDPADPAVPTELINVAKGLSLGQEEVEKQFLRAIAADAELLEPYLAKLQCLLPKWGGTVDATLAFARGAAAGAPAGSPVPMVLPNAHRELAWHLENTTANPDYYRNPEVWQELKPVFERHLQHFPEAHYTRNWMAWTAYRSGDFPTALRELDVIGDTWDLSVWGRFNALKKARAEMAAKRTAPGTAAPGGDR